MPRSIDGHLPELPGDRRPYILWIEEERVSPSLVGELHGVSADSFYPPRRGDQDEASYLTHQCRMYLRSRYGRGMDTSEYPDPNGEPVCSWYGRRDDDSLRFRAALYHWEYAEEVHAACHSQGVGWQLPWPPAEEAGARERARAWQVTLIDRIYNTDFWKDG